MVHGMPIVLYFAVLWCMACLSCCTLLCCTLHSQRTLLLLTEMHCCVVPAWHACPSASWLASRAVFVNPQLYPTPTACIKGIVQQQVRSVGQGIVQQQCTV